MSIMTCRLGLLLLVTLPLGACGEVEAASEVPKPAPTSADQIPSGTLGGEIHGAPFSVKSARYVIDRRPGFEKVDISLSAASAEEPCALRTPKDAPSVWLRRTGPKPLGREQVRLTAGGSNEWEVHYQVRDGHAWMGNGRASALIVLRAPGADMKLNGELWACFADASASCVSGRFVADYCPIRIDAPVRGTNAMERPPSKGAP